MAEIGDGGNAISGFVNEDIRAGAAGEGIVATPAIEDIVAVKAFQRVVVAVASDDVVELGAPYCIDAAYDRIVSNRYIAIGGSRSISNSLKAAPLPLTPALPAFVLVAVNPVAS